MHRDYAVVMPQWSQAFEAAGAPALAVPARTAPERDVQTIVRDTRFQRTLLDLLGVATLTVVAPVGDGSHSTNSEDGGDSKGRANDAARFRGRAAAAFASSTRARRQALRQALGRTPASRPQAAQAAALPERAVGASVQGGCGRSISAQHGAKRRTPLASSTTKAPPPTPIASTPSSTRMPGSPSGGWPRAKPVPSSAVVVRWGTFPKPSASGRNSCADHRRAGTQITHAACHATMTLHAKCQV